MKFPKKPAWAAIQEGRKYKNVKSRCYGYTWDSRLELRLYEYFLGLKTLGEVAEVEVKHRVKLTQAEIVSIPDFRVFHRLYTLPQSKVRVKNMWIFHEAKGAETDVWRIKRKLWTWYGPSILCVWKGVARKDGSASFEVVEELVPPGVQLSQQENP